VAAVRKTVLIFASPTKLVQLQTNHSNTSTAVVLQAVHIKKCAEYEFSLVSGRHITGQFMDLTMTEGETIAVTIAAVNVAYVLWGYRLRTALDRTKRHTPLSTDLTPGANSRDAVQDVSRELAADRRRSTAKPTTLRQTRPTPRRQTVDAGS
jgi:hypothetical protein